MGVVMIMVLGVLAVLLIVVLAVGRRWRSRQQAAIDSDRAERRQMQSAGRVDAWKEGAERYVDVDKLPEAPPEDFAEHGPDDDGPEHEGPPGGEDAEEFEEEQDPYGLFKDKPYQDPDDAFDDDEDEDEVDEEEDEPR